MSYCRGLAFPCRAISICGACRRIDEVDHDVYAVTGGMGRASVDEMRFASRRWRETGDVRYLLLTVEDVDALREEMTR